jgi:hypothetical protein
MTWVLLPCVAWLAMSAAGEVVTASSSQPAVERPAYHDRRFEEDWSVLRDKDPARPRDPFDRVKFMPLTKSGGAWITLAGQGRIRQEYYREFQFGASQPSQSDGYLLSRIRLSADFHAGSHLRVFAEAKSALTTHRTLTGGDTATYVDTLDLQNGFVDLMAPVGKTRVTLRVGRQELLFGTQRVVGPSDYLNVRRSFQGVSASVQAGAWTITPFWAELVLVEQHMFNNAAPGRQLFGTYATRQSGSHAGLDLYWLDVTNSAASFNGTTGRERRHSVGGRAWRDEKPGHTDFEVEAAAQFGSVDREDARASMASLNGGYTFATRLSPRLFGTFDFASGDATPGGRVGTFDQLFPTNHAYLGNTDYVGRQNIVSTSGGIAVKPSAKLSLMCLQYAFWRASVHDGLYDSSGSLLRQGAGSGARYIGVETNVVATYRFDQHWLAYASWNRFVPGGFVSATGASEISDFSYAALQFTF